MPNPMVSCPSCKGEVPAAVGTKCARCKGAGQVKKIGRPPKIKPEPPAGPDAVDLTRCVACYGSGGFVVEVIGRVVRERCLHCQGRGRVQPTITSARRTVATRHYPTADMEMR